MSSTICFCTYEDFKKCVPRSYEIMYCRNFYGYQLNAVANIDGLEHVYRGSWQPTLLTDFPKAVEVQGIQII